MRGAHRKSNQIPIGPRFNDSGRSFETQVRECPGDLIDNPRKTARPIPAHLRFAAVTIVISHPKIGFACRSLDQEHSIRPDASMTVTQERDLMRRKFVVARSIIDEHEIVPGTVHFRKLKHSRSLTYGETFNVQRSPFAGRSHRSTD